MLEGLVRRILVDRFGDYVHGMDEARLSSGLSRGELLLSDLRLKDRATEALGLAPSFKLHYGVIGKMRVDLPGLTSLGSKPVLIRVENVYLLMAACRPEANRSGSLLAEAQKLARLRKRQSIEHAMTSLLSYLPSGAGGAASSSSSSSGGFIQSFVPITVILANLRLEIINLHIRCEDSSATQPGRQFAFGISATLIKLRAVDQAGRDTFVSESTSVSRRKVEAQDLSIYWDSDINDSDNPMWVSAFDDQGGSENDDESRSTDSLRDRNDALELRMCEGIATQSGFPDFSSIRHDCFIMPPITACAYLQINSDFSNFDTGRCRVDCDIPRLALHIRSHQFKDVKSIVSYRAALQKRLSAAEILLRLQSRRPQRSVRERPIVWFQYAVLSTIELIRSRRGSRYGECRSGSWSWVTQRNICNDRRAYMSIYQRRLRRQGKSESARPLIDSAVVANGTDNGSSAAARSAVDKILGHVSSAVDIIEDDAELQRLEDRLPTPLLVLFRSLVHEHHAVEQTIKQKLEVQNATGYFSWLFTSSPGAADLSDDQKQAIRKETNLISKMNTGVVPTDFEVFHLSFETDVLFTLYQDRNGTDTGDLPLASVDVNLNVKFIQSPSSLQCHLFSKRFRASDLTAPERQPLTILSLHPSNPDVSYVLQLFLESWSDPGAHLDLSLSLNLQTTRLVWDGRFFKRVIRFLHASHNRSARRLFDAAFWQWTEAQQAFLLSSLTRHRRRHLSVSLGVLSITIVEDHPDVIGIAWRGITIRSEPDGTGNVTDRIVADLDQVQISLRSSNTVDDWILLEPLNVHCVTKLSLQLSLLDVDARFDPIHLAFDIDRLLAALHICHSAFITAFSFLRPDDAGGKPPSGPNVLRQITAPLFSVLSSPIGPVEAQSAGRFDSKSHFVTNVSFVADAISVHSLVLLRARSLAGTITPVASTVSCRTIHIYDFEHSRGCDFEPILSCSEEHQLLAVSSRRSDDDVEVTVELHSARIQWSPFTAQCLLDAYSRVIHKYSELKTLPSPSAVNVAQPGHRSISNRKMNVAFTDCNLTFNKRDRHLCQFCIGDGMIRFNSSPYSVTMDFRRSTIRDTSTAALFAVGHPPSIVTASLFHFDIDEGDPARHWMHVRGTITDCHVVFFNRFIQEFVDYFSNGVVGIWYGFNPDRKDLWPDYRPVLHGPFCLVELAFPDLRVTIPSADTRSETFRAYGIELTAENMLVSNRAYAGDDGWRSAEWIFSISRVSITHVSTRPFDGRVAITFSTDWTSTRVPWMDIDVSFSSICLRLPDKGSLRFIALSFRENFGESWVQPLLLPGENESSWYLDDVLADQASTIRVGFSTDRFEFDYHRFSLACGKVAGTLSRKADYSLILGINFLASEATLDAALLFGSQDDGFISTEWTISGDFLSNHLHVTVSNVVVEVFPTILSSSLQQLAPRSRRSDDWSWTPYVSSQLPVRPIGVNSLLKTANASREQIISVEFVSSMGDVLSLQINVAVVAIAAAQCLLTNREFGEPQFGRDADQLLDQCNLWRFFDLPSILPILQGSSSDSLVRLLRRASENSIPDSKRTDFEFGKITLDELLSFVDDRSVGLIIFLLRHHLVMDCAASKCPFPWPISFVSRLADHWSKGTWPLRCFCRPSNSQDLDDDPLATALDWSLSTRRLQDFHVPLTTSTPGLDLSLPHLFVSVLREIQTRHESNRSFLALIPTKAEAVTSLTDVVDLVSCNQVSSPQTSVRDLVSVILVCAMCRSSPILPLGHGREMHFETVLPGISRLSRHIFFGLAYLITACCSSGEIVPACLRICEYLEWNESSCHAMSACLARLCQQMSSSDPTSVTALMHDLGPPPKATVASKALSAIVVTANSLCFNISLSHDSDFCLKLVSSFDFSHSKLDNADPVITLGIERVQLLRCNRGSTGPWIGIYQVISADTGSDGVGCPLKLELASQSSEGRPGMNINARLGWVYFYLSLNDLKHAGQLYEAFCAEFNRIPRSRAPTTRSIYSIDASMKLASFSFCNPNGRVNAEGVRDSVFCFTTTVQSATIIASQDNSVAVQCSPLISCSFMHPKLAVREPVLEPVRLALSLTYRHVERLPPTRDLNSSRSLSPMVTDFSVGAKGHLSSTKDVVILVTDAVRLNISPETVSSASRVFHSASSSQPLEGSPKKGSVFMLHNLTGWTISWSAGEDSGQVDNAVCVSLFTLGPDPWEPRHALSLSFGDRWRTINDAFVGTIGSFLFPLIPHPPVTAENAYRLPHDGLVLQSIIEDGHTLLVAHSSIGYANCSTRCLRIEVVDSLDSGTRNSVKFDLEPRQRQWVPLFASAWDSFSISVVDQDGNSRRIVELSHSGLRRDLHSEYLVKVSNCSFLFICAASGGEWPGKLTITVRAPLEVSNLLAYPVQVRFNQNVDTIYSVMDGDHRQIDSVDVSASAIMFFSMPGFSWSNPIDIFEKRGKRSNAFSSEVVAIRDAISSLHVVVTVTRNLSDDALDGRALYHVTLHAQLWLVNNVPGTDLFFGSAKFESLPGQDWGEVTEIVLENQRWYPGKKWSSKLLPGDRPSWSDEEGNPRKKGTISLPGPGWSWVDEDWQISIHEGTDPEGWMYAKSFKSRFRPENRPRHLVRCRKHTRTRAFNTLHRSSGSSICMFSAPSKKTTLGKRQSQSCVTVKTATSSWSTPMNLLHGTDTRTVSLRNPQGGTVVDLGINISAAHSPFDNTWVACFIPRYIVHNSFDADHATVYIHQFSSYVPDNLCTVNPRRQQAFFFREPSDHLRRRKGIETLIRVGVRFTANPDDGEAVFWTSEFDINTVGLHVVLVKNSYGSRHVVQIQVSLDRASVILFIGETDTSRPRYLVRNELPTPVCVYQSTSSSCSTKFDIAGKSSCQDFAWDFLSVPDRLLTITMDGVSKEVEIDRLGTVGKISADAFVTVFADGVTNVLLVTASERRARRLAQIFDNNDDGSEFSGSSGSPEASDCTFRFNARVDDVGLSLIASDRSELMFASVRSIEIIMAELSSISKFDLSCDSIQVDNQLFVDRTVSPPYHFPIVLRSRCVDEQPFFWIHTVRSYHTPHMRYYKVFSVAMEPFSIFLEERYIVDMLSFAYSIQNALGMDERDRFKPVRARECLGQWVADVAEAEPFKVGELLYFEVLRTPTVKFNLSFKKSPQSLVHSYLRDEGLSMGLSQLAGVLLTNLEAKPIRRTGHVYAHLCDRAGSLRAKLVADYKGSIVLEFIGSFGYNVAALGGVVPIWSCLREGVRDFRKEIAGSLRHGNVRRGLARGTFSLIDHTARGLMMPVVGLSTGLGDAFTALTFDPEFGSRRAAEVARKPQHVIDGLLRGGRSAAMGVFNGFTAIVRQPVIGFRQRHDAIGLAKGVGKGVVQAVAAPVVGVFDAINHIGTGIAQTPRYLRRDSSLERTVGRMRLPRAFYGQAKAIRPYLLVDAVIVEALRTADPPIDGPLYYVLPARPGQGALVYAIVNRGIVAVNAPVHRNRPRLLWFQSWSSIRVIELDPQTDTIKVHVITHSERNSYRRLCLEDVPSAYESLTKMHRRHLSTLRVRRIAAGQRSPELSTSTSQNLARGMSGSTIPQSAADSLPVPETSTHNDN